MVNIADELHLVKGCKENDPSAQKHIYHLYVADMMLLCLRYVVHAEDAKEVMMDGFFSFFKNIGSFTYRGDGSVKAWLKQIVINQCLMHLRKKQPLTLAVENIEAYEDKWPDNNIEATLHTKELLKMINALPDGYRIVFNLYVFEDKSHKEIAELLGISEGTSKSQLHRAKAVLKEQIKEQERTLHNGKI